MENLIASDIRASAGGKEILTGLSLNIRKGDCIALLGPNGHGKSTFLNVLMGSPEYKVTSGSLTLDGEDLLPLAADARSRKGMFLAFQNPPDIPGVAASDFFRAGVNVRREEPVSAYEFYKMTEEAYRRVGLSPEMASRHLNEGFSGGEKKRDEILQMLLLKPQIAFLDEIDSGLDVDALNAVASVINELREQGTTFVIISHYDRLFKLVKPNRTAVIVNGRVALEGGPELAERISSEGYSFLTTEHGISLAKAETISANPSLVLPGV
jgi:Fe-S cluster assembly ATP-binding protein